MPDYDYSIKQHDLEPPLDVQLTQKGLEAPLDLTSALSVKLLMTGQRSRHKVSGTCVRVDDPAINPADSLPWGYRSGRIRYLWVQGDTDKADVYNTEFEIQWAGPPGRPQTVPNKGYKEVEIYPDLG